MSAVYIVMKETTSPIFMNHSRQDSVFMSKAEAAKYCDDKNARSKSLFYYIIKSTLMVAS